MEKWNDGLQIRHLDSTDEIELPEIVYKYRDWGNEYHKSIITDSKLYFASPRDFEDPKDCSYLVDHSLLTDEDIYNKYYQMSLQEFPYRLKEGHKIFAQAWFDRGLMRNVEHIQSINEHFQNIFFDCFGVLSLTENYRNPRMWRKYANERKGFCIGYDTRSFVRSNLNLGGGNITYYDKLPKVHPKEQDVSSYMTQIYSKEKKWDFEQEFRLHRRWKTPVSSDDRLIGVPVEFIREIIFGSEIPESHKNEIKKLAKATFPNVRFKKMKKQEK